MTADDVIQRIPFQHSEGQASPVEVAHLSELRVRGLDHSIHEPMRLTFHLLQFVTEGEGAHWVDFEQVPLYPGDVLYIRPEQVHAFDTDATHEALLVFFIPEAPRQIGVPPPMQWQATPVLRPNPRAFRFLTDLVRLHDALESDPSEVRPETVGPRLLGAVLAGLADVAAAQQGPLTLTAQRYEALVRDFEALLDAHHATSRSPSWYAAALSTTPRTLSRACRKSRDRSPKQMVDARVALETKRLLATTDDNVEAIGYALGFSEPTNFVKFFKRVEGATPEAFRRSQTGAG